jgi:hypothetical protein
MTIATGAPQVLPSTRPERISGASLSFRGVDQAFCPGALRAMKAATRSISGAKPAGRPSMTHPMAGAWDCPKTVTFNLFPSVFMEEPS